MPEDASVGSGAFANCPNLANAPAETVSFAITFSNRAAVGYTGANEEKLVIPATFIGDGKNGTTNGVKYKVASIKDSAFEQCSGLVSVVIPEGVTSVGNYAFNDCGNLTSVVIAKSVTNIGRYAFYRCADLTSIVIPEGVVSIGDNAFDHCTSLINVTIPGGVISIGAIFPNCSNLTNVDIPKSVASIAVAFWNCTSLTNINFDGTMAQWNAITKASNWDLNTGEYTVHCTDGDIAKS